MPPHPLTWPGFLQQSYRENNIKSYNLLLQSFDSIFLKAQKLPGRLVQTLSGLAISLTAHSIDGDDAVAQRQLPDQFGKSGDLIALICYRYLSQHQPILGSP